MIRSIEKRHLNLTRVLSNIKLVSIKPSYMLQLCINPTMIVITNRIIYRLPKEHKNNSNSINLNDSVVS